MVAIISAKNNKLRPAKLALLVTIALGGVGTNVYARDFFNPELLEVDNPGAGKADLSAYEAGSQAPGIYRVDIVVDDQVVESSDIDFKQVVGEGDDVKLQPCLSVEQLKRWGVRTELFPALSGQGNCANLGAIPKASADFQFGAQRLVLSIPQAALSPMARGYVPPEQWDEGINAAMLNYSLSGSNHRSRGNGDGGTDSSQYANLRPGINVGPWRLRNYTTWSRDSNGTAKWDNVYTYMQRDIIPLKAQLTTGDSTAPSDVFDSMPFRGVQLASDDDMLPDSLKGYAPVVRGIARTNAQVVIRQNGYQIYQSFVSPGAFEITDMYPTGGAGDLDVTVKEADGSEQHFVVPFASLPVLQREGRLKYSVTGGQYRSYDSNVEKTPFAQLTAIYGLSHGFTLYGGLQESSKYQSLAAGVGKNMGILGAFSVDAIQAWSTPKDGAKIGGQSWRARFSKNFEQTGTNFSIAGYRYSTSGYYSMQDVLDSYSDNAIVQDRRRNRAELTMSQALGNNLGSITLSAVREDYWNSNKTMESYSAGYNGSWSGINYGVTYTYSKNGSDTGSGRQTYYDKDQQLAVNVSIPLEKFMPNTWANYGMSASKSSGTTHQLGLSGSSLENNALNWNVQEGYGTDGVGNTGSANGDYRGSYGEVTAGYGYDKNSETLNYGLQGGVLAHADGVTLTQPLGETNVLIKAPGAKGVSVQNQSGAKTDWRGYTAVSNLSPFRKNDVELQTDTLPNDVELELTNKTMIPTRGAIVRADYVANVGGRVLMTLNQVNGQQVPFGAIVSVEGQDKSQVFIVGDAGQVYLTGLKATGKLIAKWGESKSQQCMLNYTLPEKNNEHSILVSTYQCD
ncbi:MAG TPA: fimbria/pilus outer membrane usher protein [Scandinavium sp.]|jgi:outer membrane usher protein|uniref:fimbria/pilus outer membrane usher protein n=1 Tax=Scandinavium sp. TaxID=2830653 RepID=UPI002E33B4E4|nr:fimbria/pilus outer membrane usher protein [Scandinavium sp.]HEX4503367.1 fimbria/pilus outer membrane usher protein [Scandinavium sp.]